MWVTDGWPGPFLTIFRLSLSILLLEPWCKCIWCCLYPIMEYFAIINTSQEFPQIILRFCIEAPGDKWYVVMYEYYGVVWLQWMLTNAVELTTRAGNTTWVNMRLSVFTEDDTGKTSEMLISMLSVTSMHVVKLFSVFLLNINLQEICDNICNRKAMPWTLFNLLEWGSVKDKGQEGLIVLQLRIADVWRCHRCPPKEQCNPWPPCIMAKPRDRTATVKILLFEEMQCHHRKRLKNNQNVKRVSEKSWFHRVTN